MLSRGKTEKKERKVGGKETSLADPKAKRSLFFTKIPACDWAIVVSTKKPFFWFFVYFFFSSQC